MMELTPLQIARNQLAQALTELRLAEIKYIFNDTLQNREACVDCYQAMLRAQMVYLSIEKESR